MSPSDVTVVICTIPTRAWMLARAVTSVLSQTVTPGAIVIRYDHERGGHADNRNKAMESVKTDWIAFLDDDDEWDTNHLEVLCLAANEHPDAVLIYPWHRIKDPYGKEVPDLLNGGMRPFDEDELRANNYIPVTVLARTLWLKRAQFPVSGPGLQWHKCEDWGCWIRMLDNGATFYHHPEITWTWHHHGGNTAGQGDRW